MSTFHVEEVHRELIIDKLKSIEQHYDVRVLFACEAGSRAWGFASNDSDYDVRFVYAHPRDWYLSVSENRRDVIELMDGNFDISGWDVRKALRLLAKSNPPLLEWLHSPTIYVNDGHFAPAAQRSAEISFSAMAGFQHYLHMAAGNFRQYLQGDTVWTKKYLYVIRPLLAAIWVEKNKTAPPVNFMNLVESTVPDGMLRSSIKALVQRKIAGDELAVGPRDPVLHEWIDQQFMLYPKGYQPNLSRSLQSNDQLDILFREVLDNSMRT